jgi:hypothetical protein
MFAFSLLRSINIARSRSVKASRIVMIAIPSIAIFVLIVFAAMPRITYVIGPREPSPETTITVWRLIHCRVSECDELHNSTSITNKYLQLESSMREMDQRFESMGYDEECSNNECIKITFFNQTVSFLMPTESALQLSDDLEQAGAKRASQCIEAVIHLAKLDKSCHIRNRIGLCRGLPIIIAYSVLS